MKTKDIHQEISINASPHEVYEVLMDEKKHTKLTDGEAKISREVGGEFSTFDGYARGKNVTLEPDKKIVQTWHASDWPEDAESEVTFKLEPNDHGTTIHFTHTGVPEDFADDIKDGWNEYYWQPMKTIFA